MIPSTDRTRTYFKSIDRPLMDYEVLEIDTNAEQDKFVLDLYAQHTNQRCRQYYGNKMALVMGLLPECKSTKVHGKIEPFTMPATDIGVELIRHHIPEQHIKFSTEDAAALFYGTLAKSQLQDSVGQILADYKLKHIIPEHNYELCADRPLAGYQQAALVAQKKSPGGFGLFAEQGTGKTPIIIADICNSSIEYREQQLDAQWIEHWNNGGTEDDFVPDYKKCIPYRVIVVAPNAVRLNWESEIANFTTQWGKTTVMRGTSVNRVKQLYSALTPDNEDTMYTVVIMGYQMLWRSFEYVGKVPWNLAVLDEAHAIKSCKAKQAEACIALRDISDRRIAATGTPVANSIIDLYMLLEFLGKNNSGFGSYTSFKRYYGVYETTQSGHDVLVRSQNMPFLQERLSRCSFFITKKEALPDLPEKVYDVVEVEMTEAQSKIYQKVLREIALEIEQTKSSDMPRQMMVSCILTKLLRLNQITSGFVSWSEVRDFNELTQEETVLSPKFIEWCDKTNPKAEALADLLWDRPKDEKTLIWACWIQDIEYIMSVAESLGIKAVRYDGTMSNADREESYRRFNEDRDVQWWIGTAASGGAGLNLLGYPPGRATEYDTDTTMEVFYSQTWSQIHRSQAEDRCCRRGQRRQVRIVDLAVPGSIDMEIRKRVLEKKEEGRDLANIEDVLTEIYMKEPS